MTEQLQLVSQKHCLMAKRYSLTSTGVLQKKNGFGLTSATTLHLCVFQYAAQPKFFVLSIFWRSYKRLSFWVVLKREKKTLRAGDPKITSDGV